MTMKVQNVQRLFIARLIYSIRAYFLKSVHKDDDPVSICCISDTHNVQFPLPLTDVLIHAGDLSVHGSVEEIQATIDWIDAQPHPHKIIIAGNHDHALVNDAHLVSFKSCTYLNGETFPLIVRGRRFIVYGAPWTPRFYSVAFQYPRTSFLDQSPWKALPDCDILISHGPPMGHLDLTHGDNVGDETLLLAEWNHRPRLHIFGHVHDRYGQEIVLWDRFQHAYEEIVRGVSMGLLHLFWLLLLSLFDKNKSKTLMVNAASVYGYQNQLVHEPVIVSI